MSNQEGRQAFARGLTGTAYDYQGDWHALFTLAGIPDGGRNYNERLLLWLNLQMGTSLSELNGAMDAYAATKNNGAAWNSWEGLPPPPTPTQFSVVSHNDYPTVNGVYLTNRTA